jgi:hypothetical protein
MLNWPLLTIPGEIMGMIVSTTSQYTNHFSGFTPILESFDGNASTLNQTLTTYHFGDVIVKHI